MVKINIKKKDLWLLSAIMVFLIAVGYVVAYNPAGTGNPAVMGHSYNELENVQYKIANGMTACSAANQAIKTINSTNGAVTCEADDVGGDIADVNGGNGLTPDTCLSGTCTLAVSTGVASTTGLEIVSDQVRLMDDGCAAGEVLKRNPTNAGWVCEPVVKNSFSVCADTQGSSGCFCTGSTQVSREVVYGTCTAVSDAGSCSETGCSSCVPSYQATCCVCKP